MRAITTAVASGKGGSGKTTFSINLACSLAKAGKKVLIFDADVGTANVHIAFRKKITKTLIDVIEGGAEIQETVQELAPNIDLISGGSGYTDFINLGIDKIHLTIRAFAALEGIYDHLIVDLPAGISELVVETMKASDNNFIIGNNDPSSVADAFALLKVLKSHQEKMNIIFTPNKVETLAEAKTLFQKINSLSEKYINLSLRFLGGITATKDYNHSWATGIPCCLEETTSKASTEFRSIAKGLEQPADSPISGVRFVL